MADRIVLNTPRYKGEYDLNLNEEPLTNLEWRWVKKISGYLPLTIEDGWAGGDPDLFIAFAVVAMARAGRIQEADALTVAKELESAPFDGAAITVIGEEAEEADEANPSEPADPPEPVEPLRSIGGSSRETSDLLANARSRTGVPA